MVIKHVVMLKFTDNFLCRSLTFESFESDRNQSEDGKIVKFMVKVNNRLKLVRKMINLLYITTIKTT